MPLAPVPASAADGGACDDAGGLLVGVVVDADGAFVGVAVAGENDGDLLVGVALVALDDAGGVLVAA